MSYAVTTRDDSPYTTDEDSLATEHDDWFASITPANEQQETEIFGSGIHVHLLWDMLSPPCQTEESQCNMILDDDDATTVADENDTVMIVTRLPELVFENEAPYKQIECEQPDNVTWVTSQDEYDDEETISDWEDV